MWWGNAPHTASESDRTIIRCKCGWRSEALSWDELGAFGYPWYCPGRVAVHGGAQRVCGERIVRFVTFAPHERSEAMKWLNEAKRSVA